MMAAVTRSMKARTGRSLEEWIAEVEAAPLDPLDQKAVRAWLKAEHGVPQNTQWAIADAVAQRAGWQRPSDDAYVDQQYAGPKASLRPIFDALHQELLKLGPDVRMEGRGMYLPFIRKRQFAAVAAPSRTRVEVGLRFMEAPASERLTPTQNLGQATHKLSLTSADEVPGIVALLKAAYEQNG